MLINITWKDFFNRKHLVRNQKTFLNTLFTQILSLICPVPFLLLLLLFDHWMTSPFLQVPCDIHMHTLEQPTVFFSQKKVSLLSPLSKFSTCFSLLLFKINWFHLHCFLNWNSSLKQKQNWTTKWETTNYFFSSSSQNKFAKCHYQREQKLKSK